MGAAYILAEVFAGGITAAALAFSLITAAPGMERTAPLAGAFLQNPAAAVQALRNSAVAAPAPTLRPDGPAPAFSAPAAAEPAEPPATPAESAGASVPEFDGEIPEGCGPVLEQHYGTGEGERYIRLEHGSIKNCTALSAQETAQAAAAGLPFAVEKNSDQVQVLIVHTHATESYLTESPYY